MDNIIGGALYYILAAFFMCVLLKLNFSSKKKLALSIVIFFAGFAAVMYLSIVTGIDAVLGALPLVILLPLYVVFWLISTYTGLKLLFVLLTSSILMLLPLLLGVAVSDIIDNEILMTITAILCIAGTIILLIKFFRPRFLFIMQTVDSKRYWLSICIIPILYNIAVYLLGLYNMQSEFAVTPPFFQLILMGITLAAYILIVMTFYETRKRVETGYDRDLTELQRKVALENIEQLQTSANQAAIHRHDLRHHIQMLNSYLENKEYDAMADYLKDIEQGVDETVVIDYCKNHTVNLLLSAYVKKAEKADAQIVITADIPESINVSAKDLCVVLSNALENALNAIQEIADSDKKTIFFECNIKNNRLVFVVSNHYSDKITFANGFPQNASARHGLGTQSIAAIAKKYNGMYSFEASHGIFYFKLII